MHYNQYITSGQTSLQARGAFLYDDFEYCCNRRFTRRALLSPGQPAAQQRDFARLDRGARRGRVWNIWLLLPLAIILLPFALRLCVNP